MSYFKVTFFIEKLTRKRYRREKINSCFWHLKNTRDLDYETLLHSVASTLD